MAEANHTASPPPDKTREQDLQSRIGVIAEAADEINAGNDIISMFIEMIADVLATTGDSKEINRTYALIQSIRRQLKESTEVTKRLRDEVDMLNPEGGA